MFRLIQQEPKSISKMLNIALIALTPNIFAVH